MTDDLIFTTRSTVTFKHPFTLPGFDAPHAPGTFDVDIDNERIDYGGRIAHRHVSTFIYLRSETGSRMVSVDARDLDAAGARDREIEQRVGAI